MEKPPLNPYSVLNNMMTLSIEPEQRSNQPTVAEIYREKFPINSNYADNAPNRALMTPAPMKMKSIQRPYTTRPHSKMSDKSNSAYNSNNSSRSQNKDVNRTTYKSPKTSMSIAFRAPSFNLMTN